jgi:hypothetical protein
MTTNDLAYIYVAQCKLDQGLFAGRDFAEGELIFQFTGPVIDFSDTVAKGDKQSHPLQIGPTEYIDIAAPCVFINHSCEPNAGIRDTCDVYALREIRQDEEIQFDYSTTMSENSWTMQCLCGTPSCRGIIGDFHDLSENLQHRYLSMKIVQPFIVEEWHSRQVK